MNAAKESGISSDISLSAIRAPQRVTTCRGCLPSGCRPDVHEVCLLLGGLRQARTMWDRILVHITIMLRVRRAACGGAPIGKLGNLSRRPRNHPPRPGVIAAAPNVDMRT
jgi:hypothetical protein